MTWDVAAITRVVTSPVASITVGVWTWLAHRRLGRSLRTAGITAVDQVRPPPPVAAVHRSTVSAVLRLVGATCLVRSAVLQRWDASHDCPRPLVVGVLHTPDGGIAAHAWLEGDADAEGFVELHRRSPAR